MALSQNSWFGQLVVAGAARGVYHGTISFIPNVGQAGPDTGGYNSRDDGSQTVGTFTVNLPPKARSR